MPKKDCYGIRENYRSGCDVYGTINEPVQDLLPKTTSSFYMPSQAIASFTPLVKGAQGKNPLFTKWGM
jgi:hypothetical protein